MSDCDCKLESQSRAQQRVLWLLLGINTAMFIVELVSGLIVESTGLIADSLDMLADALVYAVGLYAVGRSIRVKAQAAMLSGVFQIILAIGVAVEIVRRLVGGSEPQAVPMVVVSLIALAANVACLRLISRHRDDEVHMRASWIFSRNDVIANAGVILAGCLVYFMNSRLPDLLIGAAIVIVVAKGGFTIVADARAEKALNRKALSGG